MKTKTKVQINKTLGRGLKKYGPWFKVYRRVVKITQEAIGGELHAC